MSALLALPACAGAPLTVTTPVVGCSQLVPGEWKAGVAGADLPSDDSVGAWVAFADAQTARLDMANLRTRDAIEIVSRCEERDAVAVKSATRRRFLGIF